jgi:hypothetical protein
MAARGGPAIYDVMQYVPNDSATCSLLAKGVSFLLVSARAPARGVSFLLVGWLTRPDCAGLFGFSLQLAKVPGLCMVTGRRVVLSGLDAADLAGPQPFPALVTSRM